MTFPETDALRGATSPGAVQRAVYLPLITHRSHCER